VRVTATSLTALSALALTSTAIAQPAPSRASRPVRAETTAPWWKLVTLRLMGGASTVVGATSSPLAWAVDLHAGLRTFDPNRPPRYWVFGGDVGLSIGPRHGAIEALWTAGPGVSYGGLWFSVGWSPRVVFGALADGTALGLRNSLSACTFMGFACLDGSHQFLSTGAGSEHELRLTFGLDVGLLAQVIVRFATTRPG
jgi:hypothetical protein